MRENRLELDAALVAVEAAMKAAQQYLETWLNQRTYNTQKAYKSALNDWREWLYKRHFWFPYRYFLNPTKQDITHYVEHLIATKLPDGRPISGQTVQYKLTILRTIYQRMIEAGYSDPPNPWLGSSPDLQREERRPTALLEQAEIRHMLNCWDSGYKDRMKKAALTLLFGCALRRSEVVSILLEDLYLTHSEFGPHVVIRKQKNKKIDRLPIQPWAIPALQTWVRVRAKTSAPQLFVRENGEPLSDVYIYRTFKEALERCGIDPAKAAPHAGRASPITHLLDAGLPHREVRHFSRHASINMVEKYDKRKITPKQNPGMKLDFGKKE